jgi:hypothetical protein
VQGTATGSRLNSVRSRSSCAFIMITGQWIHPQDMGEKWDRGREEALRPRQTKDGNRSTLLNHLATSRLYIFSPRPEWAEGRPSITVWCNPQVWLMPGSGKIRL